VIALSETSRPCIDLAVKKQGYDWCGVTAVPIGEEQHLPANSSTLVRLSVIGEGQDWAEYVIDNYGINETDLRVTRLETG
jgi:hypothetical protein